MVKRDIRFDYYKLQQGVNSNSLLDCLVEIESELRQSPEVLRNKSINGYFVRLREIKKVLVDTTPNSHYFLIGHIEKIDTYSEAYVGKIDGARATYGEADDEGPIKDTIILYDPFNGIVSSHRTNALSYAQVTSFFKQITDDEDLDLEVIVDDAVIDKLEKIPGIREIEYSIAAPQRWSKLASGRSINADLDLGSKLEAGRMKVIITPEKGSFINREMAVKKVKALLPFINEEVSVLKVKGNVSENTDTLDLINGKIESLKVINIPRGKKLTFVLVKQKIEEAYREKKKLFDNMFVRSK
ncbi:hypothetical protein CSE16_11995 [Solibacillus sp. R5-41]|uniref:DUF6731 family protein n=1 Tax=Solibacillus sp. R5-41 TaxID=2048654 RepID=UPI000C126148|nr:DUF6731 family protein [Solibacillus sp. R5-41]ATP40711.1 hypothetical protein CSE16_11995 [Solibacillus sp. R5-41]